MELVNPLAEQYAKMVSSPEEDLILKVSEDTKETHPHAHMLSGQVQGSFFNYFEQIAAPPANFGNWYFYRI